MFVGPTHPSRSNLKPWHEQLTAKKIFKFESSIQTKASYL